MFYYFTYPSVFFLKTVLLGIFKSFVDTSETQVEDNPFCTQMEDYITGQQTTVPGKTKDSLDFGNNVL